MQLYGHNMYIYVSKACMLLACLGTGTRASTGTCYELLHRQCIIALQHNMVRMHGRALRKPGYDCTWARVTLLCASALLSRSC